MSVRIIDADTIELTTATGATVRMRASDYDALESATPGGKLATDYAEQTGLQPGERQGRDRYGRQLNQLTDNQGQPAGQRMVRQGFAFANSPETARAQRDFIAFGPESENDSAAQQIVNQMMALRQEQPVLPGGFDTVDFERNDRRSTTARAFDRGTENLKNSFLTFARVATDALGWDETSRELGQQALYHMEKAQVIPADMASLKDVEAAGWTPKALATFAYERLIEEVPSLLVDAGLSATGAGVGAAIGRRAGISAARGMAEEQAKDTVLAAQKKGAKAGAGVGFATSIYPQSVAQVQQELDAHGVEDANPLIALTGGAVVAGVQMAPEVILAARMLKQAGGDTAAKSFGEAMKNIAKGTAIGVAAEGSAEALATTISKEIAKAHPDANYSNWTEDDFWQLLDATAAGATVGGTLGGISSALGDLGGWANDRIKASYEAARQSEAESEKLRQEQLLQDRVNELNRQDAIRAKQQAEEDRQSSINTKLDALAPQQPPVVENPTPVEDEISSEVIARANAQDITLPQEPVPEPVSEPVPEPVSAEEVVEQETPSASEQIAAEIIESVSQQSTGLGVNISDAAKQLLEQAPDIEVDDGIQKTAQEAPIPIAPASTAATADDNLFEVPNTSLGVTEAANTPAERQYGINSKFASELYGEDGGDSLYTQFQAKLSQLDGLPANVKAFVDQPMPDVFSEDFDRNLEQLARYMNIYLPTERVNTDTAMEKAALPESIDTAALQKMLFELTRRIDDAEKYERTKGRQSDNLRDTLAFWDALRARVPALPQDLKQGIRYLIDNPESVTPKVWSVLSALATINKVSKAGIASKTGPKTLSDRVLDARLQPTRDKQLVAQEIDFEAKRQAEADKNSAAKAREDLKKIDFSIPTFSEELKEAREVITKMGLTPSELVTNLFPNTVPKRKGDARRYVTLLNNFLRLKGDKRLKDIEILVKAANFKLRRAYVTDSYRQDAAELLSSIDDDKLDAFLTEVGTESTELNKGLQRLRRLLVDNSADSEITSAVDVLVDPDNVSDVDDAYGEIQSDEDSTAIDGSEDTVAGNVIAVDNASNPEKARLRSVVDRIKEINEALIDTLAPEVKALADNYRQLTGLTELNDKDALTHLVLNARNMLAQYRPKMPNNSAESSQAFDTATIHLGSLLEGFSELIKSSPKDLENAFVQMRDQIVQNYEQQYGTAPKILSRATPETMRTFMADRVSALNSAEARNSDEIAQVGAFRTINSLTRDLLRSRLKEFFGETDNRKKLVDIINGRGDQSFAEMLSNSGVLAGPDNALGQRLNQVLNTFNNPTAHPIYRYIRSETAPSQANRRGFAKDRSNQPIGDSKSLSRTFAYQMPGVPENEYVILTGRDTGTRLKFHIAKFVGDRVNRILEKDLPDNIQLIEVISQQVDEAFSYLTDVTNEDSFAGLFGEAFDFDMSPEALKNLQVYRHIEQNTRSEATGKTNKVKGVWRLRQSRYGSMKHSDPVLGVSTGEPDETPPDAFSIIADRLNRGLSDNRPEFFDDPFDNIDGPNPMVYELYLDTETEFNIPSSRLTSPTLWTSYTYGQVQQLTYALRNRSEYHSSNMRRGIKTDMQNQKVAAARGIERVMFRLYQEYINPNSTLMLELAKGDPTKKWHSRLAAQIESLYTLTYGDKNRHLDKADDAMTAALVETAGMTLFDDMQVPDGVDRDEFTKFIAKIRKYKENAKSTRVSGKTPQISTSSFVDESHIRTIFTLADFNDIGFEQFISDYRKLTEARSYLAANQRLVADDLFYFDTVSEFFNTMGDPDDNRTQGESQDRTDSRVSGYLGRVKGFELTVIKPESMADFKMLSKAVSALDDTPQSVKNALAGKVTVTKAMDLYTAMRNIAIAKGLPVAGKLRSDKLETTSFGAKYATDAKGNRGRDLVYAGGDKDGQVISRDVLQSASIRAIRDKYLTEATQRPEDKPSDAQRAKYAIYRGKQYPATLDGDGRYYIKVPSTNKAKFAQLLVSIRKRLKEGDANTHTEVDKHRGAKEYAAYLMRTDESNYDRVDVTEVVQYGTARMRPTADFTADLRNNDQGAIRDNRAIAVTEQRNNNQATQERLSAGTRRPIRVTPGDNSPMRRTKAQLSKTDRNALVKRLSVKLARAGKFWDGEALDAIRAFLSDVNDVLGLSGRMSGTINILFDDSMDSQIDGDESGATIVISAPPALVGRVVTLHEDGTITLSRTLSAKDTGNTLQADTVIRMITELSHELAHFIGDYDNLTETEQAEVKKEYEANTTVKERLDYPVHEYFADRLAAELMKLNRRTDIVAEPIKPRSNIAKRKNDLIIRVAAAMSKIVEGGINLLKELFPNRKGFWADETESVNKVITNIIDGDLRFGSVFRGFNNNPRITAAKAKQLATKFGNGAYEGVKFVLPTAARVRKVSEKLARMIYTPPRSHDGKRVSYEAGILARRTMYNNYVRKVYVGDRRGLVKDYEKFLATGNAPARLENLFRMVGTDLAKYDKNFEYSGIPVLFNEVDLVSRAGDVAAIMKQNLTTDADKEAVDEFIRSFDFKAGNPSDVDIKVGNPFGRTKAFWAIVGKDKTIVQRLTAAGFLHRPGQDGVLQFLTQAAARAEFAAIFGESDLDGKFSVNAKLQNILLDIKDIGQRNEAIAMLHSIFGFDAMRVHPAWRSVNDLAVSLTSLAVLPFAGLASLPDPIMPFIRTGSWSNAVKGLFSIAKMWATNPTKTREMLRAVSMANGAIHDTVYGTMVSNNRLMQKIPDGISKAVFTMNGLNFITNLSRNISAALAVDAIVQHAFNNSNDSQDFIKSLSLTPSEAQQIAQYYAQHKTLPAFDPTGDNTLHEAAVRAVTVFTSESVIHPSRSQLPALFNNPNFRMFTLLKPFLYGFGAVIYGGNFRESRRRFNQAKDLGDLVLNSPAISMPFILAFGLMMPLAALGLELREWIREKWMGQDGRIAALDSLDSTEYARRIFGRAGGLVMLEIFMQAYEGSEYGRSPIVTLAGPTAGIIDQIYRDIGMIERGTRDTVRFGVWDFDAMVK